LTRYLKNCKYEYPSLDARLRRHDSEGNNLPYLVKEV
jgi:hypothetical protein